MAAAGPAGSAAMAVAVIVKLTRVLLLAPVVAGVSLMKHRSAQGGGAAPKAARPPVIPVFVLAFLACVLVSRAGVVPDAAVQLIAHVQIAALAAALFGLGTGVRVATLLRGGGLAILLGAASTVLAAGVSLAGILWLT